MSGAIARLLLSMLLMPMMVVVFFGGVILSGEFGSLRDWQQCLVGGGATAVLAAVYWCIVWRRAVYWTVRRTSLTCIAAALALVLGVAVYFGLNLWTGDEEWIGVILGSATAILGWLIATVFIWQESRLERAERLAQLGAGNVACPACGYNLTGLRSTTCPECGASFSIQELVAAAKGIGELEG